MSHFAKLDPETNEVIFVTVGRQEDDGKEVELSARTGDIYRQTSYNTRGGIHYTDGEPSADQSKAFRFNYAGIGYTFDETIGTDGAFIPPKPHSAWVLDEATCLWESPIPYPEDGAFYVWSDDVDDWVEVPQSTDNIV